MKKRSSLFFTIEVVLFILFIPVLINLVFLDYQVIHPFLMKKQPQSAYQPLEQKQGMITPLVSVTPTASVSLTPTSLTKPASRSAVQIHVK